MFESFGAAVGERNKEAAEEGLDCLDDEMEMTF